MAGKFNFTTKLGLDSAGFKAGVNKVRGSLNSLKAGFLSLASSLGAGLGLYQLITNLKDTATQLSVAKNTLKNVSYQTKVFKDGTKDMSVEMTTYADNLAFVKKLSEDYAQDLVAVTDNYAKFTAASKKTSLSLEDQRMVFEALTKAAAYYHLSADRTADMMNAVTQMMSKGKVAAEELRRQLGNTLPGAFNLMAASLGVSNAKLDEMMRNGQVIAAEVLPQFAAMLNSVTTTAEFDSLQASLNKLKNSWYGLVENSGAEGFFKSIVDGTTKVVSAISNNIKGLLGTVKAFVVAVASYKLFKGWEQQGKEYIANQKAQLETLKREQQSYLNKMGLTSSDKYGRMRIEDGVEAERVKGMNLSQQDLKMIRNYNETLLKIHAIKQDINETTLLSERDIAKIRQANVEFDKMLVKEKEATFWTKTWTTAAAGVKNIFKTIGATLASMGIMAIVSAVIGGLTKILQNAKEIRKEWERIDNIYTDYEGRVSEVDENIAGNKKKIQNQLDIVKDLSKDEKARLGALKLINQTLGLTGDKMLTLADLNKIDKDGIDKITKAVNDWNAAAETQSKIQKHLNEYLDAERIKKDKTTELAKKQEEYEQGIAHNKALADAGATGGYRSGGYFKRLETEISQITTEIEQQQKVMKDAEKQVEDYGYTIAEIIGQDEKVETSLKGLAKIMEDYKNDTKELATQLKEGAISKKEYNEQLLKITKEAYKAAALTGEVSLEKIMEKMESDKALTTLEKFYVELRDTALKTAQTLVLESIAEAAIKDIDEALTQELKEIEKELEKLLEGDEKRKQINVDYAGVSSELAFERSKNKRDSTFDYKKTKADIFGEEADIARDNLDKVDAKIQELLQKEKELIDETGKGLDDIAQRQLENLREDYRVLSREAETLEDAFKFEQIKQDIEDLNKSMTTGVFSGVENLATSLDRVVDGARELRELMENVDTSGWEKLMGVANYIFNIINGVLGVIETINTLTEISNQLASARSILDTKKQTDTAIELESTLAQIAAEQTLTATKQQQATFETAITTNKIAQAEASLGLATALGVETAAWLALAAAQKDAAMAAAAANAAMVAGPAAPAAALAAAAEVGAGLTATMAAFAKGGIIGGNSTHGDRNLIRANSGEMILTKGQQGTLFSMLNGKGGMGGNVEFKIRGADLVGTINNYSSRRKG